jgi:predicted phosphodiesterase
MSLIVVGDLHLKNKVPFFQYQKEFLDWLLSNYNDKVIMILGDIFDSSSPIWEVYKEFKEFLLKRNNETHIIVGNHDISKSKGCSLSAFNLIDKVTVYEDKSEMYIENINCIILPYNYSYKEYEKLEGEFDFIFTHITPTEVQFANEGIEFPNLKGIFVHGHTHIQNLYRDKYNNIHYILGVPIESRHLENQQHHIMEIDSDKNIKLIDVPFFFTHETVKYGDIPSNKRNIINVIDAPNKKLVYEKYKDYYIRDTGIKLLRTENTAETFKEAFEHSNILDKFKTYAVDKGLSKEVLECCSQKLLQIV